MIEKVPMKVVFGDFARHYNEAAEKQGKIVTDVNAVLDGRGNVIFDVTLADQPASKPKTAPPKTAPPKKKSVAKRASKK